MYENITGVKEKCLTMMINTIELADQSARNVKILSKFLRPTR